MPNFGCETIGGTTTDDFDGLIYGGYFASGGEGEGASITVYILSGTSNVKCGLYDASNNFVANSETEEKVPTEGAWNTFNFGGTKPSIANANYTICVWAAGGTYGRYTSNTNKIRSESSSYNSFPASLSWPNDWDGYNMSIYCTYTAAAELGAFYQRRNPFGINIQSCGQVRGG